MRVIALLLSLFISVAAFAQRPIPAEERRRLGELLPYLFDTMYAIPETGTKAAEQLRAWFARGKYDSATNAADLAKAINDDLATLNDRHVSLRFTGKDVERPVLTVDAWKGRTPHPPSAPSPLPGRGEGALHTKSPLHIKSVGCT